MRLSFGASFHACSFWNGQKNTKISFRQTEEEYLLYDPQIFVILADWLQLMKDQFICGEDEILIKAERIHPMLKSFLKDCGFAAVWSKIRRNVKDEKTLTRQFNDWFDGFKTLKLINYFTKEVYPQINMFEALDRILSMSGMAEIKIRFRNKNSRTGRANKDSAIFTDDNMTIRYIKID